MARPLRLKGKRDPLLWDRPDARTYWKLSEIEEIKNVS